jgi:very-short-patch-repair endonuclease
MSTFETQVVELYDDNKSTYEIAEILHSYPNKVRRALVKMGRPLRNKSEAQKNALDTGRIDHPTKGRERSYDDKLKISTALTDYWDRMPEEQRQRIHDAAIAAIKRAGQEGSKLEKFLYEKLLSSYTVEFHKKNLIPNQNLEIDLFVPRLRTIIEIDGPSHFLPVWGDEKLRNQMAADLDKSGLILSKGFVIVRLKVLKTLSLAKMKEAHLKVLSILQSIESKFPSQSKRYIEVDL